MPNCDFYAAGADLDALLAYVFGLPDARVWEHYSPYNTELTEFHSVEEIKRRYPLGAPQGTACSVLLQLQPVAARGDVRTNRISLDPRRCNGATYRYALEGWGLIQLQLGGVGPRGLVQSHTNHNTRKRALTWEAQCLDRLGRVDAWDWREVTRVSSKINRYIRGHLAVDRVGSRPVLPQAHEVMRAGSSPSN